MVQLCVHARCGYPIQPVWLGLLLAGVLRFLRRWLLSRYGYYGRPGYYRGFAGGHVAGVGAMHAGAGFRAGGGFHGGRR